MFCLGAAMRESFATPAENAEAFLNALAAGGLVVIGISLVALLLSSDSFEKVHVKPVATVAFAGFACVLWIAHASTFAHFIAAEATPSGIRLQFVGPFEQDVFLARGTIDAVLFGALGKSNRSCYLKVLSKSGESYRSVTLDKEVRMCKRLRIKILEAMANDQSGSVLP